MGFPRMVMYHHPVSIAAHAVAVVRASVARPATSLFGRVLRWRSTVYVFYPALAFGGSDSERGRSMLRWEGQWASVTGESCWTTAAFWDPEHMACPFAHVAGRYDLDGKSAAGRTGARRVVAFRAPRRTARGVCVCACVQALCGPPCPPWTAPGRESNVNVSVHIGLTSAEGRG